MKDLHVRQAGRPVSQDFHQVVVQFDGHDATSLAGQRAGKRAEARTGLQHRVLA